ncbi:nuclease-related domain-containing protein [Neobacillus pocheonensis]|uniref:nuclease-related domain-containing protein n=1 Tax=Neobacillus pocheonensis TaxID=363869 RepID=UPI003D2C80D2
MIAKPRQIPLNIQVLLALLRRLPKNHIKRTQILEELGRRQAGFQGEESLDFHLSHLPEKEFIILHDLNLPDGKYNCQIDTFLLTSKFALIIEVKNLKGKLTFDLINDQLIQKYDGIEKGYAYPVSQAQRKISIIKKLLSDWHLPQVPIDFMIVISNQYAILEFIGNIPEIRKRVCKADIFLKRVGLFENIYTKEILSPKELRKFTKLLIKANTPPTSHIMEKYSIKKYDLLTGPHCPTCSYLPLTREKRKWFCPICNTYLNDAHIYLLQDYFLLFDIKITNREFRRVAHIESPDTSGRMLRSVNLCCTGKNKDRVYFPAKFPWEN